MTRINYVTSRDISLYLKIIVSIFHFRYKLIINFPIFYFYKIDIF